MIVDECIICDKILNEKKYPLGKSWVCRDCKADHKKRLQFNKWIDKTLEEFKKQIASGKDADKK